MIGRELADFFAGQTRQGWGKHEKRILEQEV
jgi:hypothetical protein